MQFGRYPFYIDVIHELCDIRLGKWSHGCSFGDHIANELMVPFAVAFS